MRIWDEVYVIWKWWLKRFELCVNERMNMSWVWKWRGERGFFYRGFGGYGHGSNWSTKEPRMGYERACSAPNPTRQHPNTGPTFPTLESIFISLHIKENDKWIHTSSVSHMYSHIAMLPSYIHGHRIKGKLFYILLCWTMRVVRFMMGIIRLYFRFI